MTPPPAHNGPGGLAKSAVSAAERARADAGVIPPASNHIPRQIRVVPPVPLANLFHGKKEELEMSNVIKMKNTRQRKRNTSSMTAISDRSLCVILSGGVPSVHERYKMRALEMGASALEPEEFWNKFRRRYPGTCWGWANCGTDDYYCIGRVVFVGLGPDDRSLQSGGEDAVLDAFIETQDSFSGEPHSLDEFFGA